ncbi:hypothetical protein KI387_025104, partial [Taxus chinensis]
MFEEERSHGEQVADQEDTMKEVEHLQQDNKEADYLSYLRDCFDEKEPMEIISFSPPSIFHAHELAAMKENIQVQKPALHNGPLEPRLEDLDLPCSSKEEEGKRQEDVIISLTPFIQEGPQENSILGVETQNKWHIQRIRLCPIRYLASLEPMEKPKPVMPTSGHEDELP